MLLPDKKVKRKFCNSLVACGNADKDSAFPILLYVSGQLGEQLLLKCCFFMFLSSIFNVSDVKKKTCVPEYNFPLNFKSNIVPPPIVLTMYN